MKINVKRFKEVLVKSTLNYLIDSTQLNFTEDSIESGMKLNETAFTIIDVKNDVISGITEPFSFNFGDPLQDVKPFLDLIDDEEEIDLDVHKEYIIIDKKFRLFFDDQNIISTFPKNNINFDKFESVQSFVIDKDFMLKYAKIAKIGSKFGKVYFLVKDDKFYIQTTDRTNSYSNSVKFLLGDSSFRNLVLCFDYIQLIKLMNVIEDREDDFSFEIYWREKIGMGFLYCFNEEKSEEYILGSLSET